MAHIENKQQEDRCKLNFISNLIKCKWNRHSNQKAALSGGIKLESSQVTEQ